MSQLTEHQRHALDRLRRVGRTPGPPDHPRRNHKPLNSEHRPPQAVISDKPSAKPADQPEGEPAP